MDARATAVSVENIVKTFHTSDKHVRALDGVDIHVAAGEVVALLGASGCGKTTLLRSVAGLEKPDGGKISIAGKVVYSGADGIDVPPEARRLGMVFQSYALWPHMTVAQNLSYPLSNTALAPSEITRRVGEALETASCAHLADRMPSQLSGGQQQRVALARAIAYQPRLLLFDEPLSNLDAKLRERMRVDLLVLQRRLGFAAIYVTHDQAEAMTIAHRIVLMHGGKVLQVGTPREIYEHPASPYVAGFVGTMNFIAGECLDRAHVRTPAGDLACTPAADHSGAVVVGVRPEHLAIADASLRMAPAMRGTIIATSYLGHTMSYVVEVAPGVEWTMNGATHVALAVGQEVPLHVEPSRWLVFRKSE